MSEIKHIRARIFGIVQGVGYRWFAEREAISRNISGYVRNLKDGSVEVEAQGKEEDIAEFIDILRKGPIAGLVTDMQLEWVPPDETLETFEIRY